MTGTDNETDGFELSDDEQGGIGGTPDALFGAYSVISPGVQIILDGRAVSAPNGD
jgi:hypothetical protein